MPENAPASNPAPEKSKQKKGGCLPLILLVVIVLCARTVWRAWHPAPDEPAKVEESSSSLAPIKNVSDAVDFEKMKQDLEKPASASVYQPGQDIHGAWVAAQYRIEARLKNPKSAKFPFGGAVDHVRHVGNDVYDVRSWVDAQNALGAVVRTKFHLRIQRLSDSKWQLVGDVEMWE